MRFNYLRENLTSYVDKKQHPRDNSFQGTKNRDPVVHLMSYGPGLYKKATVCGDEVPRVRRVFDHPSALLIATPKAG